MGNFLFHTQAHTHTHTNTHEVEGCLSSSLISEGWKTLPVKKKKDSARDTKKKNERKARSRMHTGVSVLATQTGTRGLTSRN
jgi:hypothetical protein